MATKEEVWKTEVRSGARNTTEPGGSKKEEGGGGFYTK